ncbi:tyrosine-type recombinase/integrase [Vreelandella salicampi]|uniref:Site-specific integrase n=1 Tax=Vreelandella salicampi TaxID=1449798 RepID=A0A7Z0LK98_9GAMM|nr:site-specific integrase [Halomonas salicampi]NYS60554.1 site-specific integrase [Halomonas salicampi]
MGITVRFREKRERWIVTETHNGQRHQRSFEGTREGERQAKEYATARRAALNDARFNGEAMGRQPRRTFLEAVERWIDEYDVSSQIKAIRPVIMYMGEDVLLGMETVDKARRMARDLKLKGRSQSTINNHIQIVKRVLNLAYREWEWLDRPLGDKLKKPNPKNERHVYLAVGDLQRLLQAIPDKRGDDKKLIALAALTGLRQGELLSLDPSNVQGGRILLRPDQTKNGKTRVVPVPEDAQPWLRDLPFASDKYTLRWTWGAARKAIGREDLRFHDLRHSYASLLAQAGENMTTVRDLLGHSSLLVTSRYSHIFDGGLDAVGSKLPSLNGAFGAAICDQTATTH